MLKAVRDLVIVKEQFDPPEKSGIIIPDTVDPSTLKKQGPEGDKGTTRRGIIVSAGPAQTEYVVGDLIHFDQYAGILIYDRETNYTYVVIQNFEPVAVDTLKEVAVKGKFDA